MTQLKNAKFYLEAKLGQRGAEMVEYALVLACVCAVGAIVYAVNGSGNSLGQIVKELWNNIGDSASKAQGTTTGTTTTTPAN